VGTVLLDNKLDHFFLRIVLFVYCCCFVCLCISWIYAFIFSPRFPDTTI